MLRGTKAAQDRPNRARKAQAPGLKTAHQTLDFPAFPALDKPRFRLV
jgi:hypothetical protein